LDSILNLWPVFILAVVLISVFLQQRKAGEFEQSASEDEGALKEVTRCSALINGQNYTWIIGFKLGREDLCVFCELPKWQFSVPLASVTTRKSRGLFGERVHMLSEGQEFARVSASTYREIFGISGSRLPAP
jgi:hypothetical protein